MEQMCNDMNALLVGAQTKESREECALGMEQNANVVAVMGAQMMPRKEVYAPDMEECSYAGAKDAYKKLRKEGCASGMEEREHAVSKDVQIIPN